MDNQDMLNAMDRLRQENARLKMSNARLSAELFWYKKLWLKLDRLIQTHPTDSLTDFVKALFEKEI